MLLAAALVGTLLGVDSGRVMPLDPGTLRPLTRGEAVGRMLGPVAHSPDGRRVALAVRPAGRVKIVGGRTVATGTRTAWLAWAGERVFSVGPDGAVAIVDPARGRVVARSNVRSTNGDREGAPGTVRIIDAQAAGSRVAVLLEDRLAIVSADGAVRGVALPGLGLGGLAASASTAYVATASGVLEVSLATEAVTRHAVARAAKDDRPWRSAALLDERTLAVAGCDQMAADHRGCARPYGLRLLDTRTWRVRMLEPRAAAFRRAGRFLVLDASAFGEGRRLGLRAYTPDGVLRVDVFRGHDIVSQLGSTHAYVHIIGRPGSATRAIDLRTGATRLLPARVPQLL